MNPSAYQRGSGFGSKLQNFELEQFGPFVQRKRICRVVASAGGVKYCDVAIRATVPDARIIATLVLQFLPTVPGLSVAANASTLWLSSTDDLGDGPKPVENLFGTAAAPATFVGTGLWGFSYSPTEEVSSMQAACRLYGSASGALGEWVAQMRWQALRPLSDADWRLAISLCKLEAPEGLIIEAS